MDKNALQVLQLEILKVLHTLQTHPKPHISGGLRRQKRQACGEFSGKLDCRTERFTPCEFSETVHLLDMAFTTSKADSRIPTVAWTA